MVKPEWGTKRTCPKCSTRFYDLGSEDPVHCISCGNDWVPEPVLKSKQPLAFEVARPTTKEPAQDDELAAGPSTAITGGLFFSDFATISPAKRAALTGAYAYGKARRRTRGQAPRHAFYWS